MTRAEAEALVGERRARGYTMRAIAGELARAGFPMSKNAVIGVVARRFPELQSPEARARVPTTTMQRLDALHARMDAVLGECAASRHLHYVPLPTHRWATDGRTNRLVARADPLPPGWRHGRTSGVG